RAVIELGRPRPRRNQPAAPFVQVQPAALPGRRGARRSFWDVGPQGPAVGAPRQKVRWPIPHMCLVPPAGPEPLVWFLLTVPATAMTEPRGVATRGERSSLEAPPFQTAVRQVGNSGVRALTL